MRWRLEESKSGQLAGPGVWNVNDSATPVAPSGTLDHLVKQSRTTLSTTKNYSIRINYVRSNQITQSTISSIVSIPARHPRLTMDPHRANSPQERQNSAIIKPLDHRATPSVLGAIARAGNAVPIRQGGVEDRGLDDPGHARAGAAYRKGCVPCKAQATRTTTRMW